jgi:uncharacterized protein (TIGR00661 family)
MALTMLRQLPKLLYDIVQEHRTLDSIITEYNIDAVISDNRWGAYSKRIPSIYMVHQIRILLPSYLQWGQFILDLVNTMLIRAYQEVWIPDFESEPNLTGVMSHNSLHIRNSFFIGALSRLKKISGQKKVNDIIVILSGVEPQRTVFEELVVSQLKETTYRALIVRGVTEETATVKLTDTITMVNSMNTNELSEAIASSHVILSRSGHSTVMDLAFLGSNAIFVPTPQQTEQEYLAHRLKEQKICYFETQDEFSLTRAMTQFSSYSGFSRMENNHAVLRERIDHLLSRL